MSDEYFKLLNEAAPSERLQHLISGYWLTEAIGVAINLGIPDQLAGGPKLSTELVSATSSNAQALYRLLRTLASVGLFSEVEQGRFALTEMGALLRKDLPTSLRPIAAELLGDEFRETFRNLGFSVETGRTAFSHVYGMEVWEYRAQHAEENTRFNAFQASLREYGRGGGSEL